MSPLLPIANCFQPAGVSEWAVIWGAHTKVVRTLVSRNCLALSLHLAIADALGHDRHPALIEPAPLDLCRPPAAATVELEP
jgi:hypothetical protein